MNSEEPSHIVDKQPPSVNEAMQGPARVADAVRARREELGLTQVDLAKLGDASHPWLHKLERATGGHPREKTWHPLEAILGWAQGSFDKIANQGRSPIDTVPARLLQITYENLSNWRPVSDEDEIRKRAWLIKFRTLIGSANVHGQFDPVIKIGIVDLVEALGDQMHTGLAAEEPEAYDTFVREFYEALKTTQPAKGSYTTDRSVTDLAHTEKPLPSSTHLPTKLEEELAGTHIIDFGTLPHEEDDNVVVIAMLVKKDTDQPFSSRDIERLQQFQQTKGHE